MKQQQGAALVIVMALLSGALMLGMSGMQSALIDERLAGNYRASTQAQMTTENILATLASDENKDARESYLTECVVNGCESLKSDEIAELLSQDALNKLVDDLIPEDLKNNPELQDQLNEIRSDLLARLVVDIDVDIENKTVTIAARDEGLRNGARQNASLVYSFINGKSGIDTGFVACNGISFSGGNQEGYTVDAFNSRLGPYRDDNNFGERAFLYSLNENSSVVFGSGANYSGFAGIKADVYSAGDISVLNNSPVDGNFYSGGEIEFLGNSFLLTENVYAERGVTFHVGARVDGNVNSNQSVEVLGNWGVVQPFQPNGSTRAGTSFAIGGDAVAPLIYTQIENRIEGEQRLESPGFEFDEVLNPELRVVNVGDECPSYRVYEDYAFFKYKKNPKDVNVVNWDKQSDVSELGASSEIDGYDVYHVNRLSIGGNGLLIEKPTVIVADSDVTLTLWNDAAITLSNGASLKIITKGITTVNGNDAFQVNNNAFLVEVGGKIIPAFSLISLYEDGAGVAISSEGDTYMEVVAPFTGVTVSSTARLLGRVFADFIEVSGGGSLHYDLGYGSENTNLDGSGLSNGEGLAWELSKWR